MENSNKKQEPDVPITHIVNQYGERSINVAHVEYLNMPTFTNQASDAHDENGRPYVPLAPTRYDSSTGIIYLGNEKIRLPIELVPQSDFDQDALPYVDALCEVYAEKLNQVITPDMVDKLPKGLKKHFTNQRKAFYSAESVQRSVREVFSNGEQQFNELKKDAYEGIEPTYSSDRYTSGYERLEAVLEKITNTTLDRSGLLNVVGLIGNLEKKGVCHILVNDDTIKSWVDVDE